MYVSSTSLSSPPLSHHRHVGDSARADRMSPRQAEPQRVDDDSSGRTDTRGPRNPLVAAMLQAMQGLVGTTPATATTDATAAAPATGTNTTTTTAPTTSTADDAASLKEAAVAFAHELFGALRELGASGNGERRHGWHHDGHHGGNGHGYGNLAQRLDRLATRLEGSAGTVDSEPPPTPLPAGATDPVVQPAPAPSPTIPTTDTTTVADATATGATLPTASTPVSLPAVADDDAPAAGGIHITININLGGAGAASGPLDKIKSAFEQLFKALQPAAADTTAGADGASNKLVSFLRSMAQSLRSSGDTAATSMPTRSGLVNLVA